MTITRVVDSDIHGNRSTMQPVSLIRAAEAPASYYTEAILHWASLKGSGTEPPIVGRVLAVINPASACAALMMGYSIISSVQDITFTPNIPASQARIHTAMRRLSSKQELPMTKCDPLLASIVDAVRPRLTMSDHYSAEVVSYISDAAETDDQASTFVKDLLNFNGEGRPGQPRTLSVVVAAYNTLVHFIEIFMGGLLRALTPSGLGADYNLIYINACGNTFRMFTSYPVAQRDPTALARAVYFSTFWNRVTANWLTASPS